MDAKLAKIYYSPQGYWKGVSGIKKISEVAKVPENVVKQLLFKQALWQIYLPAPRHVPRPKFDVSTPNSVHQADLLFLPHDKLPRDRKIYKYALTVVDVASLYKEAEPLTSKDSAEVVKAFQSIYQHSPLTWPQMLQVDPGREFMGSVTQEMENTKHTFAAVALKFTEIRPLSSISIARLQSACLAISMPWKCFCLRACGQLHGPKDFLKLLVL